MAAREKDIARVTEMGQKIAARALSYMSPDAQAIAEGVREAFAPPARQRQYVAISPDGEIMARIPRGVVSKIEHHDDDSYTVTITEVREDGTPLTWMDKLAEP